MSFVFVQMYFIFLNQKVRMCFLPAVVSIESSSMYLQMSATCGSEYVIWSIRPDWCAGRRQRAVQWLAEKN